jgi:polyisoprenoid-binding protein YceI
MSDVRGYRRLETVDPRHRSPGSSVAERGGHDQDEAERAVHLALTFIRQDFSMRKWLIGAGIAVVALVVLVVGGTWIYINVIKDDPPERLTLQSLDSTTTSAPGTTQAASSDGASTTAAAHAPTATTPAASGGSDASSSEGVDGEWKATDASVLGYRVKEVLFGQSTEAVGRTNSITGGLSIDGTTVTSAAFTVDMASVKSDSDRRDDQFRGRIMDTDTFPTATFKLTQPLDFGKVGADGEVISVSATGDLTLRGTTKSVTMDLQARRNGGNIEVSSSIPIVFADWGIPNPSLGPADTEDNGVIEFALVFQRAAQT